MPRRDTGGRSREDDRYKKAATDALTLLDWCIEYLNDNHQERVAKQLAQNRRRIRERLTPGR